MRKLKLTLMVAMMSISTFGFADNHTDSSEAEVLKVLSAYMDARNTRDFNAVIAMSSKTGTLDTNSDGSFHKPQTKQTIEGWEKSGDYRTRVTMNWIKEGGNWVLSSAHYSPASYGGVHKTQASDFED
jgi:ketosteroid isomerase-like protein